jgi:hypothetical protein
MIALAMPIWVICTANNDHETPIKEPKIAPPSI